MKADNRCDKCGAYVASGHGVDQFFHTTCATTPPGIEMTTMPVISTGHLTYAEANANPSAFPAFTLIVADIDVEENPHFPNLAKLGVWAKAHGWDWIRFDRDYGIVLEADQVRST